MDPDTQLDYVYVDHDNDNLRLHRSQNLAAPFNQINKITNGLGAVTEITYETLSSTDHYTRIGGIGTTDVQVPTCVMQVRCTPVAQNSTRTQTVADASAFYETINDPFSDLAEMDNSLNPDDVNPVLELFGPMAIVTRVDSSSPSVDANGTLNTNAMAGIEYRYSQARVQAGGRGMLGFKMLSSIDLQTDVETRTTYRQDWPFIGHPLTTEGAPGQRRPAQSIHQCLESGRDRWHRPE